MFTPVFIVGGFIDDQVCINRGTGYHFAGCLAHDPLEDTGVAEDDILAQGMGTLGIAAGNLGRIGGLWVIGIDAGAQSQIAHRDADDRGIDRVRHRIRDKLEVSTRIRAYLIGPPKQGMAALEGDRAAGITDGSLITCKYLSRDLGIHGRKHIEFTGASLWDGKILDGFDL